MRAVLVVAALARVAHADDDVEPAVANAGEANLESTASRQGVQLTGAVGGSLAIGFSVPDANGTGGALSLRLGEPMTPQWVLTAEVEGAGQLHRTPGANGTTELDNDTNLLIGAQYYPNDSFFVRVGTGIGTYMQTKAARDGLDHKYVGPAFAFGAGLELVKLKHIVFDFELFSVSMANRAGVLTTSAFGLGATIH
jgi:hypothetical protein